jgi:hypothetical protein
MSGKAKNGAAAKQPSSTKKKRGLLTPTFIGAVLVALSALVFAHQTGLTSRAPAPKRAHSEAETSDPTPTRETGRARAQLRPPAHAPEDAIGLQARLRPAPAAHAPIEADPSCVDSQSACASWAANGECDNNPGFMHANCVKACGRCGASGDNEADATAEWRLPELPGVDWAALEAADAAADAPSADELAARCAAVDALLSPHRIPGLHVVCQLAGGATLSSARLAVWRDADRSAHGGGPSHVFALPAAAPDGSAALRSMAELIGAVGARLRFAWRGAQWQPPAWFTPDGARLASLAAVSRALDGGRPVCLYEGGQFIWPPATVGSERSAMLPDGQVASVRTLSLRPLVLSIEHFLKPDEVSHIVGKASPFLIKSGVALKDHDVGKKAAEFRTSSQYFLPTEGDVKLEEIDARVQALMRVPITHAEYIQVLRYEKLEHYSAQCAHARAAAAAPRRASPRRARADGS